MKKKKKGPELLPTTVLSDEWLEARPEGASASTSNEIGMKVDEYGFVTIQVPPDGCPVRIVGFKKKNASNDDARYVVLPVATSKNEGGAILLDASSLQKGVPPNEFLFRVVGLSKENAALVAGFQQQIDSLRLFSNKNQHKKQQVLSILD